MTSNSATRPVLPQSELLFSGFVAASIETLPSQRKCDLINAFWPELRRTPAKYIEAYYVDLFRYFRRLLTDLKGSSYRFAIQDLSSVLWLIQEMNTHRTLPKIELIDRIKITSPRSDEDDITRSIELVIRFWLGIHVSTKPQWLSIGTKDPRDTHIQWPKEQSLEEMVAATFKQKTGWTVTDNYIIDNSFTAVKLRRICRINIRWTNNLVDHLNLEGPRGDRVLSVYYHKICLVNHRDRIDPPIINPAIANEAIRTLDLLFPLGDDKTAEFLEEEGLHFYSVCPTDQPRPTDLNEFIHWRSHLGQLLRLLNGPPETMAQTLLDTRNASQFATLWVAIFGVFFLTILFGILATVYSAKQYAVAVRSYDLAVAVACVEHPELRWCHNQL